MAIKKSVAKVVGNPGTAAREAHGTVEALVITYWGSLVNEHFFLINHWQIQAIFNASTLATKQIAIRVNNTGNPVNLTVEWLSLTPALEANINNAAFEPTVQYFIIIRAEYDTMNSNGTNKILAARIGKTSVGDIVLFLNSTNTTFIKNYGAGGGGAGAGIRIPPLG